MTIYSATDGLPSSKKNALDKVKRCTAITAVETRNSICYKINQVSVMIGSWYGPETTERKKWFSAGFCLDAGGGDIY